jgi:NADH-quinone oxidoreductase subunit J
MVLFVMVIMLFDLRKEIASFSGSRFSVVLKAVCGLFLTSALAIAIRQGVIALNVSAADASPTQQIEGVKALATKLFTQYVLAFEALGVLLLVVAVGVVAVARSKGGTHAQHN